MLDVKEAVMPPQAGKGSAALSTSHARPSTYPSKRETTGGLSSHVPPLDLSRAEAIQSKRLLRHEKLHNPPNAVTLTGGPSQSKENTIVKVAVLPERRAPAGLLTTAPVAAAEGGREANAGTMESHEEDVGRVLLPPAGGFSGGYATADNAVAQGWSPGLPSPFPSQPVTIVQGPHLSSPIAQVLNFPTLDPKRLHASPDSAALPRFLTTSEKFGFSSSAPAQTASPYLPFQNVEHWTLPPSFAGVVLGPDVIKYGAPDPRPCLDTHLYGKGGNTLALEDASMFLLDTARTQRLADSSQCCAGSPCSQWFRAAAAPPERSRKLSSESNRTTPQKKVEYTTTGTQSRKEEEGFISRLSRGLMSAMYSPDFSGGQIKTKPLTYYRRPPGDERMKGSSVGGSEKSSKFASPALSKTELDKLSAAGVQQPQALHAAVAAAFLPAASPAATAAVFPAAGRSLPPDAAFRAAAAAAGFPAAAAVSPAGIAVQGSSLPIQQQRLYSAPPEAVRDRTSHVGTEGHYYYSAAAPSGVVLRQRPDGSTVLESVAQAVVVSPELQQQQTAAQKKVAAPAVGEEAPRMPASDGKTTTTTSLPPFASTSLSPWKELEELKEQYHHVQDHFQKENEDLKTENVRLQATLGNIQKRVNLILSELQDIKAKGTLANSSAAEAREELAERCSTMLAELLNEPLPEAEPPQQIGPLSVLSSFSEAQLQALLAMERAAAGEAPVVALRATPAAARPETPAVKDSAVPSLPPTLAAAGGPSVPGEAGGAVAAAHETPAAKPHPTTAAAAPAPVPQPTSAAKPAAVPKPAATVAAKPAVARQPSVAAKPAAVAAKPTLSGQIAVAAKPAAVAAKPALAGHPAVAAKPATAAKAEAAAAKPAVAGQAAVAAKPAAVTKLPTAAAPGAAGPPSAGTVKAAATKDSQTFAAAGGAADKDFAEEALRTATAAQGRAAFPAREGDYVRVSLGEGHVAAGATKKQDASAAREEMMQEVKSSPDTAGKAAGRPPVQRQGEQARAVSAAAAKHPAAAAPAAAAEGAAGKRTGTEVSSVKEKSRGKDAEGAPEEQVGATVGDGAAAQKSAAVVGASETAGAAQGQKKGGDQPLQQRTSTENFAGFFSLFFGGGGSGSGEKTANEETRKSTTDGIRRSTSKEAAVASPPPAAGIEKKAAALVRGKSAEVKQDTAPAKKTPAVAEKAGLQPKEMQTSKADMQAVKAKQHAAATALPAPLTKTAGPASEVAEDKEKQELTKATPGLPGVAPVAMKKAPDPAAEKKTPGLLPIKKTAAAEKKAAALPTATEEAPAKHPPERPSESKAAAEEKSPVKEEAPRAAGEVPAEKAGETAAKATGPPPTEKAKHAAPADVAQFQKRASIENAAEDKKGVARLASLEKPHKEATLLKKTALSATKNAAVVPPAAAMPVAIKAVTPASQPTAAAPTAAGKQLPTPVAKVEAKSPASTEAEEGGPPSAGAPAAAATPAAAKIVAPGKVPLPAGKQLPTPVAKVEAKSPASTEAEEGGPPSAGAPAAAATPATAKIVAPGKVPSPAGKQLPTPVAKVGAKSPASTEAEEVGAPSAGPPGAAAAVSGKVPLAAGEAPRGIDVTTPSKEGPKAKSAAGAAVKTAPLVAAKKVPSRIAKVATTVGTAVPLKAAQSGVEVTNKSEVAVKKTSTADELASAATARAEDKKGTELAEEDAAFSTGDAGNAVAKPAAATEQVLQRGTSRGEAKEQTLQARAKGSPPPGKIGGIPPASPTSGNVVGDSIGRRMGTDVDTQKKDAQMHGPSMIKTGSRGTAGAARVDSREEEQMRKEVLAEEGKEIQEKGKIEAGDGKVVEVPLVRRESVVEEQKARTGDLTTAARGTAENEEGKTLAAKAEVTRRGSIGKTGKDVMRKQSAGRGGVDLKDVAAREGPARAGSAEAEIRNAGEQEQTKEEVQVKVEGGKAEAGDLLKRGNSASKTVNGIDVKTQNRTPERKGSRAEHGQPLPTFSSGLSGFFYNIFGQPSATGEAEAETT